nr:FlgD immunoglobulin-like domain containing protein [Candidatus Krumholzibacteria bacterium]
LYDLRGRHVKTLVSGQVEAGAHTVVWQGTDAQGLPVSSGVYLARMETDGKVMVTKLMLTR